ncbi:osteoclast stimulatory transmembrane protein [Osmerus mordax]|uniref:osteoclast stimulatory transmembrane protein n=1 Tax=Osmerus mordax TaxID=8014 RepID=UPI003510681C
MRSMQFAFPSKGSCQGTLKSTLLYLCHIYSKPTPVAKEIMILLSLCLTNAVLTGALLFRWLSAILRYDPDTSGIIACVCSVVIFLLSVLFHPLRCVLTMMLPTLCTKQGRKLVISTSVMVLVLNIIPNITINVGAVMHIVKCTSEGFAHTLLNSSAILIGAKEELVRQTTTAKQNPLFLLGDLVTNLNKFDEVTQIDVSEVKKRFLNISRQVEMDFVHANALLKQCKLVSNRILAAFFIIYLIIDSACYLSSYLTSVKFDNVYLTNKLIQKASNNGVHITATKNIVNSAGCKITKEEFSKCLTSVVVVSLYFTAVILVIALDHIVYYLVTKIETWLLDVPASFANMSVNYVIQFYVPASCLTKPCVAFELINFHKGYKESFSPASFLCDPQFSSPDLEVRVWLGLLFLLSYTMVFLEIYARRLRRAITASFYRKHEEKRMDFLLKKIQVKQRYEKKGFFHITIAQESTGHVVL